MPSTWRDLLEELHPVFRRGSTYRLFGALACGMILAGRPVIHRLYHLVQDLTVWFGSDQTEPRGSLRAAGESRADATPQGSLGAEPQGHVRRCPFAAANI
jgi:hypothetical protein